MASIPPSGQGGGDKESLSCRWSVVPAQGLGRCGTQEGRAVLLAVSEPGPGASTGSGTSSHSRQLEFLGPGHCCAFSFLITGLERLQLKLFPLQLTLYPSSQCHPSCAWRGLSWGCSHVASLFPVSRMGPGDLQDGVTAPRPSSASPVPTWASLHPARHSQGRPSSYSHYTLLAWLDFKCVFKSFFWQGMHDASFADFLKQ